MKKFRRARLDVLPSQHLFHSLRDRFQGFSGPVGSGKTLALCDKAIMLAYTNRGRWGLLGAPTYPMLRDVSLRTLFERMQDNGVPFTFHKQEMYLTLPECGSRILLRSLDAYNRLRGTNLAWFAVDETSYCREEAWMQLEARLRDPHAKMRVGCGAWTPNGHDWVYRRFIGVNKLQGYKAILAKPFENHHLPRDYYESMLRSYSKAFAEQEALGLYLDISGARAYTQFHDEQNVYYAAETDETRWRRGFQACAYTPKRPLLWSLDFNINPACSVIAQTIDRQPHERAGALRASQVGSLRAQLNILDELYMPDATTYDVCEEFLVRTAKLRKPGRRVTVYVYGDSSGNQRHSNAERTDWQIIREFFNQHANEFNVSFRVRSGNPAIKDRVNAVNMMCQNFMGERRMLVHERCKELRADLLEVNWSADPNGNLLTKLSEKDKMRTHISDALGYLVEREFGMYPINGLRPGVVC